jgi:hypothetical protein
MSKTSGKEFIDFWGWAAEKGLMNENTARALSAAAKRVISIDEEWEEKDVSKINPDEHIGRFNNLSSREFKPESLQAYARRFKQALSLFMEYQRDPANWKPSTVISPTKRARVQKQDSLKNGFQGSEGIVDDESEASTAQSFMEYPFPLRESCIVRLRLPSDLKVAEVERLSAFMKALAVDFSASKGN